MSKLKEEINIERNSIDILVTQKNIPLTEQAFELLLIESILQEEGLNE